MKSLANMLLGASLLVITLAMTVVVMYVHYNSKEVSLRNKLAAKQKLNEASFDTMFRILKDQAKLTEKDREDFKKFYPEIISKTYENDKNLLAKFVQTRSPEWNQEMYKKLMVSVEAERHRFLRDQAELANLKQEHDSLIDGPVSKLFVGTKEKAAITIVTSSTAQDTFKSGTDNTDPLKQ